MRINKLEYAYLTSGYRYNSPWLEESFNTKTKEWEYHVLDYLIDEIDLISEFDYDISDRLSDKEASELDKFIERKFGLLYKVVSDECTYTNFEKAYTCNNLVFEYQGKYFMFEYAYSDYLNFRDLWEHDSHYKDYIECKEVFPHEKTIIEYY